MANEFSPNDRPARRWDKAAAFAAIAVLPPIVILALEAGTAARVWSIISGTHPAVPAPPKLLHMPQADAVMWAWVIFFAVLALVYAIDTGTGSSDWATSLASDDYFDADSEPATGVATSRAAVTNEPSGDGGKSLPVVHNLPEAQALLKKGGEMYAVGKYEEAIASFDKALRLYPRLAGAWARKGLANNAKGQYQEAIRCYDEALRLDARDAAVWHEKGNTLCAVGRLEGALNCYNEALIIDPREARAWNNKGICLASLGHPEEGLPCCLRATQIDPSYAVAWQARAMIEERLGRVQDAVASYKQFITLASTGDPATVEKIKQYVVVLESVVASPPAA